MADRLLYLILLSIWRDKIFSVRELVYFGLRLSLALINASFLAISTAWEPERTVGNPVAQFENVMNITKIDKRSVATKRSVGKEKRSTLLEHRRFAGKIYFRMNCSIVMIHIHCTSTSHRSKLIANIIDIIVENYGETIKRSIQVRILITSFPLICIISKFQKDLFTVLLDNFTRTLD